MATFNDIRARFASVLEYGVFEEVKFDDEKGLIKYLQDLKTKPRENTVFRVANRVVPKPEIDKLIGKEGITFDKDDTKQEPAKVQGNGYVGEKDKSLKDIKSKETEEFNRDLGISDKEFNEKNEKYAMPIPPEPFKMPADLLEDPKFPKKYLTALERMMNTQPKGDATKWEHFSSLSGGAGQVSAQAGELMVMMGSTMSDEEWNKFTEAILNHDKAFNEANPKLKDAKYKIVDKSWVQAATQSRKAIKDRLEAQYGKGTKIVTGAWDTKDDVEALGLSDYKKSKGFSTDMYLKIETPDGKILLDEVSLKKSTKVNFLNSGAGQFDDWYDGKLPDYINQSVYRSKARSRNISYVEKNKSKIEKFLASDEGANLQKVLDSKKMDLEKALEGSSRSKQKVLWKAIEEMAKKGDKDAIAIVKQEKEAHAKFQKDSVKSIVENESMRNGMLETIKSEFPIKAVSEGEETMAIGPYSLDKKTMNEIFGTDDYEKLKENLVAEVDEKGNPFIGYRVEKSGEVFAIADIDIREDGRGYGGQFRFDMKLNQKQFAKVLKAAHEKVYGKA